MNRAEFMRELEELLSDISPEERQEAIDYYNGYFDEAGEENEAQVIYELGSPGKVAAIIKDDLRRSAKEEESWTSGSVEWNEDDFKKEGDSTKQSQNETGSNFGGDFGNHSNNNSGTRKERGYQDRKPRSTGFIVMIVILGILASPLLIAGVCTVFGIFAGIIGAVIGILCALSFGGAGMMIGGLVLAVVSLVGMLSAKGLGLLGISGGLLLLVIGMLFVLAFILLVVKVVPVVIRGIVAICQRMFGSRKGGSNEEVR